MYALCALTRHCSIVLYQSAFTHTWQRGGLEWNQCCLHCLTLGISSFNLHHVKFILCAGVHTGLREGDKNTPSVLETFQTSICTAVAEHRFTILRSSWCSKSSSSGLNVTSFPASSTTPDENMSNSQWKKMHALCTKKKKIILFEGTVWGKTGGLANVKCIPSIWTQGGAIRSFHMAWNPLDERGLKIHLNWTMLGYWFTPGLAAQLLIASLLPLPQTT